MRIIYMRRNFFFVAHFIKQSVVQLMGNENGIYWSPEHPRSRAEDSILSTHYPSSAPQRAILNSPLSRFSGRPTRKPTSAESSRGSLDTEPTRPVACFIYMKKRRERGQIPSHRFIFPQTLTPSSSLQPPLHHELPRSTPFPSSPLQLPSQKIFPLLSST